jgi:hypothetical protein
MSICAFVKSGGNISHTTCEHGTQVIGCLQLAEMRGYILHAASSVVGNNGGEWLTETVLQEEREDYRGWMRQKPNEMEHWMSMHGETGGGNQLCHCSVSDELGLDLQEHPNMGDVLSWLKLLM